MPIDTEVAVGMLPLAEEVAVDGRLIVSSDHTLSLPESSAAEEVESSEVISTSFIPLAYSSEGEILGDNEKALFSMLGLEYTNIKDIITELYDLHDGAVKEPYKSKIDSFTDTEKDRFIELLRTLGYVNKMAPSIGDNFSLVVVNGAFPNERFDILRELLESGVEIGKILVITTSLVPLIIDGCKTNELENMKRISSLKGIQDYIPEENIIFVDSAAYAITRDDGAKITPNTADTVIQVFKEYGEIFNSLIEKEQSVLIISNQPYNLYQQYIFDTIAEGKFVGGVLKTVVAGLEYEEKTISTILSGMIKHLNAILRKNNQRFLTK